MTQGALTASLVDKLAVRRGVLASLGPTAVSSVIPGPSDLPIRYRMYQSWAVSSSAAATAVIGSGVFSIGSQLILPSIAGVPTAIPLTPGSAGVTELGFVGLLTAAAGGDWMNQITAGVLLYRLMTWILIIPVGLGALGVWRQGVRAADRRT